MKAVFNHLLFSRLIRFESVVKFKARKESENPELRISLPSGEHQYTYPWERLVPDKFILIDFSFCEEKAPRIETSECGVRDKPFCRSYLPGARRENRMEILSLSTR